MRRRAASQTWTLSRVHRVLRPLRTKVAALSASLKKERRSGIPLNTVAPTPTPTRKPPLRRTYQAQRKRKRGLDNSEDDGGQYIPETEKPRPSKQKQPKPERRWSPEVLERMSAVIDAFRVLADVVYDEQMETEPGGENVLKLRDLCVRALATDIEPSAIAAAGPSQDDSDDDGELVDVTNIVDERFEEIPDHLRRGSIVPYALSMIKQHVDTITPLPQLWNHILGICMSSSASPSAPNTADVMQICSNLFFAALHQPRSGSRGLASVYRNIVGSGPDKISPEIFCQTFLDVLTPEEENLEDNYEVSPEFGVLPFQPLSRTNLMQSPTRTPARRRSIIPPTPPTYNPSADSDDPTGALFPIRSLLSRSVGHLVAELSPSELLAFVETAARALLRWVQSDQYAVMSRERPNVYQRKADDVRSLAPRLCARIGDWVAMVLADVWGRPIGLVELGKAAMALGQVVEFTLGQTSASVDDTLNDVLRPWTNKGSRLDINDPFCALTCVYFAKHSKESPLNGESSKLAALLYRLPLTGRNCNILVGTLSGLPGAQDNGDATPPRRPRPFNFPEPPSPSVVSASTPEFSYPPPTFLQAIKIYAQALALANCSHLETTLLQLIVNDCPYVGDDVEEMLEEAEARWDKLGSDNVNNEDGEWQWARSKWRWDEITNTWVDVNKPQPFREYAPAPAPSRQRAPRKPSADTNRKKKPRKPAEFIAVSSDTEAGWEGQGADSDDAFAAIPTPKYTNRHQIRSPIKTRRQSLGLPRSAPVEDDSGDEYQNPVGRRRRNASRSARPSFNWNWGESESESESQSDSEADKAVESNSEEENDFDWARYNGSYHPHDRLPTQGSSKPTGSRRSLRHSSSVFVSSSSPYNDSDEENRQVSSEPRSIRPNRVVPAPAIKRQRLVVEIPVPSKKTANRSFSTASSEKRPVLGEHNAPRRQSASNKPKMQLYVSPPRRRTLPTAQEITTSTLERLCSQFAQLSSDDDRDMVIDLVEDSDFVEDSQDETEDTCIERRRAMPSSDDMNLFQVVTPASRKVRPRASLW